jgi:A/G-specific adenine glycosylase
MDKGLFQEKLLHWFDQQGRKNLPWQHPISPYRVWVSEIMLQQTQVTTVIPYFQRFMQRFPDLKTLANASIDEVLEHWAGLGYYARARNLHKTAQIILEKVDFPDNVEALILLPGIGLSTAGAISSIAFNHPAAILDGNVRRVLARIHALSGGSGTPAVTKKLWALSHFYTPQKRVGDYTQAIMDLGATVCTRSTPTCSSCPFLAACKAYLQDKVTDYPSPKPKKIKPVKSLVFLMLYDSKQQVLLEKRPSKGIWGGLWSFPEFENITKANQWCEKQSFQIKQQTCLKIARHTFSHYHLDYLPLLIISDNLVKIRLENADVLWYNGAQIKTLALPAPIKQLLQNSKEKKPDGKNDSLCKVR